MALFWTAVAERSGDTAFPLCERSYFLAMIGHR